MFEFDYEFDGAPKEVYGVKFYFGCSDGKRVEIWRLYLDQDKREHFQSRQFYITNNSEIASWDRDGIAALGLTKERIAEINALAKRMLKLQLFM